MRAFVSAGRSVAMFSLAAVPAFLIAAGVDAGTLANEDLRTCLTRESDEFFKKLAMAIGSGVLDPSKIDDEFIARGTDAMIETCKQSSGQAAEPDISAFRADMAKWHVQLDRRLTDLANKGGAD
jgi:hypothetical protein